MTIVSAVPRQFAEGTTPTQTPRPIVSSVLTQFSESGDTTGHRVIWRRPHLWSPRPNFATNCRPSAATILPPSSARISLEISERIWFPILPSALEVLLVLPAGLRCRPNHRATPYCLTRLYALSLSLSTPWVAQAFQPAFPVCFHRSSQAGKPAPPIASLSQPPGLGHDVSSMPRPRDAGTSTLPVTCLPAWRTLSPLPGERRKPPSSHSLPESF
jgi:hypothetical protein